MDTASSSAETLAQPWITVSCISRATRLRSSSTARKRACTCLQPHAVGGKHGGERQRGASRQKPRRAIEMREPFDFERRLADAFRHVHFEGLHAKLVSPRGQLVKGFAPPQCFGPFAVVILQHVAEPDALLRPQADRRVVDLQFAVARGRHDAPRDRHLPAIEERLLDGHLWQTFRTRLGGHDADRAAIAGKPDFAIRGDATGRRHAAVDLGRLDAVGESIESHCRVKSGMLGETVQILARHGEDGVRAAHPEGAALVFENLINTGRQAFGGAEIS